MHLPTVAGDGAGLYEERLADIVRRIVPDLGVGEPAAHSPLTEYGIDSFTLAEILTGIEEEFDVVFAPSDDLGDPVTVRSLAAHLGRTGAARN